MLLTQKQSDLNIDYKCISCQYQKHFYTQVEMQLLFSQNIQMLNVFNNTKKGAEAELCALAQTDRNHAGRQVGIVGQRERKISYSLQHSEQHQGNHQCTQRRTRADECQLGQNKLFLRTPLGQKGEVEMRDRERRMLSNYRRFDPSDAFSNTLNSYLIDSFVYRLNANKIANPIHNFNDERRQPGFRFHISNIKIQM